MFTVSCLKAFRGGLINPISNDCLCKKFNKFKFLLVMF